MTDRIAGTDDAADTSRNIVVLCDGTANEFSADRTSVAKLAMALTKDPSRQLVYYHPGIGTRAPPGFPMPVGNRLSRLLGLAFAYGLKDDVYDAYVFIMNHWRPGDRLFLFGFSRGAYTARVVAALIRYYGIAMPGNDPLIPYAIRMLWRMGGSAGDRFKDQLALADQYRDALSMAACNIHFLGCWDTVSSVGWVGSPVAIPGTSQNPVVLTMRHAVSIDEHRAFFRTNLAQAVAGQDVVQVWFPGDHCDVGGGHPEADSGISKYALRWMAEEARLAGLLVDPDRLDLILGGGGGGYSKADPSAPLHNSTTWKWWPAEFVLKKHWNAATGVSRRRMNLFRRRSMGTSPLVHGVAWDIPGYSARIPEGSRMLAP